MEKIKKSFSDDSSNKEKYYCIICNYQARDNYNYNRHLKLKNHIKNINDSLLVFKCNNEGCDFETTEKYNLNKHIKSQHEEIKAYTHKCEACNQYLRDNEKVQTHCKNESHKQNVIIKYPETCKGGIKMNGKWLQDPILILSMKERYITKLNNINNKILVKDKKKKIIKENEHKIINIYTQDYVEYYYLTDRKKEELINNAIKWMKQNNIDPNDEGYSANNELNDNYILIYNIFSDNTSEYFKNFGINVKNIC